MSAQEDAGPSDKTIVTEMPTDMMPAQPTDAPAVVPATDASPTVAPATAESPPLAAATDAWSATSSEMRTDPSPAGASAPSSETRTEPPAKEGLDSKRMSLLEHLGELRSRLRNAGIAFVVAMIGSFVLVERYFD